MSKKKRNRRPPPAPGRPAAVTAGPATIESLDGDEGIDDASPAMDDVEPVVDVALAQAAALAQAEPPSASTDEPGPSPVLQTAPAVGALPSWSAQGTGDIRGVLIQIGGGRLLLPNATIAEVLSYAEPEPEASGAEWLLGRFRWRGWQLPLIAFSRLAGIGEDKPGLGSKVIVLKALGGDRRIPYFAIVTHGFPRLVTVSRTALSVESADATLPVAVQALVRLNDEPALLPDLLQIEQHLREAREAA